MIGRTVVVGLRGIFVNENGMLVNIDVVVLSLGVVWEMLEA